MQRIFGLVGFPLSHSFSPAYFQNKFEKEGISDAVYKLFSLNNIQYIRELSIHYNLCGLNVTIPHKTDVLLYLDDLSEEAETIGAVNTIQILNGKWIGYNTDAIGFEKSLLEFTGNDVSDLKSLILGDGGSAKSVRYVLNKLNIPYQTVSRKPENIIYHNLTREIIENHRLIINTTPQGMWPDIDKFPDIPYQYLTERHFLFDLIYNPEKSLFLTYGEAQNAKIKNGLQMLQIQAESAWQIWNQ